MPKAFRKPHLAELSVGNPLKAAAGARCAVAQPGRLKTCCLWAPRVVLSVGQPLAIQFSKVT